MWWAGMEVMKINDHNLSAVQCNAVLCSAVSCTT